MLRLAPALLVVLAACDVGSFSKAGPGTVDAMGSNAGDSALPIDAIDNTACVPRTVPPEAAHVHAAGGTRAGEACSQAACHAIGTENPWLASGTVYNAADPTKVQAGVLVRIQQGAATPLRAVTDDAGNFHIQDLGQTPTFPAVIEVTACLNAPEIRPMGTMAVDKAALNCTRAGCHSAAPMEMKITL